ncbi:MAG TPA: dihydrofolate reductase family protein [Candidatus Limnocylindrales bacterium]|nr:dihydrofolate reductase family protein [Candidatus Limnocylindrales bacterium]
MTKTRYYTATSVDGFIADSDNSLDWLFTVEREGPGRFNEFFKDVKAMCMGATTYEWVLDHHPDSWRDYYGDTPCWVFTHRELPAIAGGRPHFVQGDVRPVHEEMVKAANGGDIWIVGGGELVGLFADAGLLDEILLGVAPVFLGAGAPLLPRRLLSSQVRLIDVARDGQMAALTYAVKYS